MRWLPPPGRVATPLAILLAVELLLNRVLTRTSIFLPRAAAAPMAVVAVSGTVLMVAVALLAFVALLSLSLRGRGPSASRVLAGTLLMVLIGTLVVASAFLAVAALGLTVGAVVAYARSAASRRRDAIPSFVLAFGIAGIGYFHTANVVARIGLPAHPALYVASEVAILTAISIAGLWVIRGLKPFPLAVATFLTVLLALLYLRSPSLFAAVAYWSLGYGLFVPPLFFAAVWLGAVGILVERSRGRSLAAASLAILFVAGIDIRVSYVASSIVFAAALAALASRSEVAEMSPSPGGLREVVSTRT